jgi:hypothetical protein
MALFSGTSKILLNSHNVDDLLVQNSSIGSAEPAEIYMVSLGQLIPKENVNVAQMCMGGSD